MHKRNDLQNSRTFEDITPNNISIVGAETLLGKRYNEAQKN